MGRNLTWQIGRPFLRMFNFIRTKLRSLHNCGANFGLGGLKLLEQYIHHCHCTSFHIVSQYNGQITRTYTKLCVWFTGKFSLKSSSPGLFSNLLQVSSSFWNIWITKSSNSKIRIITLFVPNILKIRQQV